MEVHRVRKGEVGKSELAKIKSFKEGPDGFTNDETSGFLPEISCRGRGSKEEGCKRGRAGDDLWPRARSCELQLSSFVLFVFLLSTSSSPPLLPFSTCSPSLSSSALEHHHLSLPKNSLQRRSRTLVNRPGKFSPSFPFLPPFSSSAPISFL